MTHGSNERGGYAPSLLPRISGNLGDDRIHNGASAEIPWGRLPRDRVPYSAIVDRPRLKLPRGVRMIVWTIANVEEWSIERAMPRTVLPPPGSMTAGQPLQPDLPNWTWHEYGMRVGFWRVKEVFERYKVVPTLAVNGSALKSYPRIAEAARDARWEFMGHGFLQGPMHHLPDQRAAIRDTVQAIRDFTGRAPRGWESPGLTETYDTIDFLHEEGIEYVADWVLDDQPVPIRTSRGQVIALPYTVEVNDIPMAALQHLDSDAMAKRGIDQFDRLYAESTSIARVMAVSVHMYLTGVPHRIGWLEKLYKHMRAKKGVALWTGEQILDWYLAQHR